MNKPTIDKYGNKFWYNKIGECHRINEPAVIATDKNKYWFKNGKLHRLDGPAVFIPCFMSIREFNSRSFYSM